ncbi:MAG TPA: hypothetical protein VKA95_08275 [Nitrososphaeraceae archaeon]|nr:hypothetical protein [Nitrososphaeraceae archaeon]
MSKNTIHSISSKEEQGIYQLNEEEHTNIRTLLTLQNIQYLVEGLDALLYTNLDGYERAKVIQLRDELTSYINSIFIDYS